MRIIIKYIFEIILWEVRWVMSYIFCYIEMVVGNVGSCDVIIYLGYFRSMGGYISF